MTDQDLTKLNEMAPAMHDGFRLFHYDGWKLIIAGSQDHCYYHNVEIVCHGLEHINIAQSFHLERFELSREGEYEVISL